MEGDDTGVGVIREGSAIYNYCTIELMGLVLPVWDIYHGNRKNCGGSSSGVASGKRGKKSKKKAKKKVGVNPPLRVGNDLSMGVM